MQQRGLKRGDVRFGGAAAARVAALARAAVDGELGEVRARRGDAQNFRDVHPRALDVQRHERRQRRGERGDAPRGQPERAVAQV